MKIFSYFKPFDYIFIIIAILISFIPNAITSFKYGAADNVQNVAIVKIDGQIVDEFPLNESGEHFTKTYHPGPNQYNIIEVKNDQIRIKEDNSPDQIGVRTGWISLPGQTAVCLPHNFIIEVTGQISGDELILPL